MAEAIGTCWILRSYQYDHFVTKSATSYMDAVRMNVMVVSDHEAKMLLVAEGSDVGLRAGGMRRAIIIVCGLCI